MATTLTSTGIQFPDATVQTSAATGGRISVSDTAPTVPTQGDVWYDSGTAYRAYVWSSTAQAWVDIAPAGTAPVNKVTVGISAPGTFTVGDIWFDIANTKTYIRTSSAWVDIASTSTSGSGNYAQLFTSSGTFTIPSGVNGFKITLTGAGASGSPSYTIGGSGGNSYPGAQGASGGSLIGWYNLTSLTTKPTTFTVVVSPTNGASSISGTGVTTFSATGSGGIGSGGSINIRGNIAQNNAFFGAYGGGGAGGIPASELSEAIGPGAGGSGAVLIEW